MKAWNRKKRPKHHTKPKWKIKDRELVKATILITLNMKRHIKNNFFGINIFFPTMLVFKPKKKLKFIELVGNSD